MLMLKEASKLAQEHEGTQQLMLMDRMRIAVGRHTFGSGATRSLMSTLASYVGEMGIR